LFWKIYFAPYAFYQKIYYPRYLAKTKIVCNSKFTQEALKSKFPNYEDTILYPPIETERFKNEDMRARENIVVTCSRFVPEKNLQLIPKIASLTPDIQYHIIGGTNRFSPTVINKIQREIKNLGCSNVYLHPDASTDELLAMYKRAKVYLHTMIAEHFGISIVEAMAAGVVPIVHRSGGAYIDIIDKDKYGFSYQEPEEAAECIRLIVFNSDTQNRYSQKAVNRAQFFSKQNFKKQFLMYLNSKIELNNNS
jgi:glycosyltransferase involved in cell wall biosynthesis